MEISHERRSVESDETSLASKTALTYGLKELAKPNLAYRLGLFWIILDPFVIALIYAFLIVVVRGNYDGYSIIIGVLTLQAMNRGISRNMTLNIASEPFPMMHTPTKPLVISRFSTDLTQAAFVGLSGSIVIIFMAKAPLLLVIYLPLICVFLSLIGTSLGIIISPISIIIKDIQKIISYLLLASLFILAVLYDYDMTSGNHRAFLSLIPHTFGVEWIRHIVSGETFPFSVNHVATVCFCWAILLCLGLIRTEKNRWRLTSWT